MAAAPCTNCQSHLPAAALACPVCGSPAPGGRRIIGTTPPPAASAGAPRRPRLVAAPAPTATAPATATAAPAPTTTIAAAAAPTAAGTRPATPAGNRHRGLGLRITGHVSSSVDFDHREVGSGAAYALMILALVGLVIAAALILVQALAVLVMPLVVLVIIVSVVVSRAAGLDVLKSILGFGAGAAGRAVPGLPNRPGARTLDIARFRIVDDAGVPYDCEILGELRAPPPRLNDDVEVVGRRRRDGVVQVRRLHNLVAGTTLRGRVPLSVSGAQLAPWLLVGTIVLAIVLIAGHGG